MKVQRAAELCHFHLSLPRVFPLLSRQKQSEEMSGEALTAAAAAEEDDEIETEYDKIGRRGGERQREGRSEKGR